jgi:hypothetical protein
MADDKAPGALDQETENAALSDALAAEHAAIWGYGVVGAALKDAARPQAEDAESAHRGVRDQVSALLASRKAEVVDAKAAYALPFPVLSDVDAASLAVVLEDGVAKAWVRVLDQSAERSTRQLGVDVLSATEVRAVGWRAAAGKTPLTTPFPGLPAS